MKSKTVKKKRGRPWEGIGKIQTIKGKKYRPCACPLHQGQLLPLNGIYFHKGTGLGGFHRYCKEYRNTRAKNKTSDTIKTVRPKQKCAKCRKEYLLIAEHWQRDCKHQSGFRPTCKNCLKKKTAQEPDTIII